MEIPKDVVAKGYMKVYGDEAFQRDVALDYLVFQEDVATARYVVTERDVAAWEDVVAQGDIVVYDMW
jgi:hypothetical protein